MLIHTSTGVRARLVPVLCSCLLVIGLVSSGCTKYRVALPDGGDDTAGTGTGGSIGILLPDGHALDAEADSPADGKDAALEHLDAPLDQKSDLASSPGQDADAGKSTSANGSICTAGSDCTSGNCVENVCCDTACTDACHSCRNSLTASSADGTCAGIASGKDDPKSRCGAPTTPITCGNTGHCDGKGACEKYGGTTICSTASCATGSFTAASTCDGKGGCTPGATQDCKGFNCTVAAGCATTCAGDQDCAGGYCSTAMTCAAKKIDGSMCTTNNECVHGTCVTGICCENACTGTCLSCANAETGAANGLCKPISSGGSSKGKCAVDTTTCGHDGTCDGNGACRFRSATTPCRTASCMLGVATAAANCDGAGNCPGASTKSCNAFACIGTDCGTTCTTNTACAVGAACFAPQCTTCGAGMTVCPGACANLQADKQNCGACGAACEGYQYCHAGKCTPTYAWTRVLPVLPNDASAFIRSAAVGSTGDIFLQAEIDAGATPTTVTFSNAIEPSTQVPTMFGTLVVGRYSSDNSLKLGADLANLFAGYPNGITIFSMSSIGLTSSDDLMLASVDVLPPPPGPGTPPPSPLLLGRFDSANSLTRRWVGTYPVVGFSPPPVVRTIFPRPPRGDYITLGDAGNGGQIVQVLENGAAVNVLGPYSARTAALGSDQTTLWLAGLGGGAPATLSPWSPTTTTVPAGMSYVIGARDSAASFGPWITTSTNSGQGGSFVTLVATPVNDLIALVGGGGFNAVISLNGGEILGSQDILSIFKFATSTGKVVWKKALPNGLVPLVTVAPDGSTIVVIPQNSTYGLTMYGDADGSIQASFTNGGGAQAIVAGGNSLYILGFVRGSTNFSPGVKSDNQGSLQGIFVTRFAY